MLEKTSAKEIDRALLAKDLRECSILVERGEFSPKMYHVLGDFHTYVGSASKSDSSTAASTNSPGPSVKPFAHFPKIFPRKHKETTTDTPASSANAAHNGIPPLPTPASVPDTAYPAAQEEPPKKRATIKELKAIAEAAGIPTAGMERADLEEVARKVAQKEEEDEEKRVEKDRKIQEEKRRQLEEEQRQRVAAARAEAAAKQKAEEDRKRTMEEARKLGEALKAAEESKRQEELRRKLEEQTRQKAAEEKHRQEEQKRRKEEEKRRQEELQRKKAVEDQRRQEEEKRRKQKEIDELYRLQEEIRQQAEDVARRQQEELRRLQKEKEAQEADPFGLFSNDPAPPSPSPPQPQQPPRPTQPQSPVPPQPPFPTQPQSPVPPPQPPRPSPVNLEVVKKNVLIRWALQPPQLQHLRPIADLLCTVHTVFPPALGVTSHTHFTKWTPIRRDELIPSGSNSPDPEKVKKSVRTLRVFLHPDRLPKDLSEDQQFICKLLWDVANDAWEEYQKQREDLDWIQL